MNVGVQPASRQQQSPLTDTRVPRRCALISRAGPYVASRRSTSGGVDERGRARSSRHERSVPAGVRGRASHGAGGADASKLEHSPALRSDRIRGRAEPGRVAPGDAVAPGAWAGRRADPDGVSIPAAPAGRRLRGGAPVGDARLHRWPGCRGAVGSTRCIRAYRLHSDRASRDRGRGPLLLRIRDIRRGRVHPRGAAQPRSRAQTHGRRGDRLARPQHHLAGSHRDSASWSHRDRGHHEPQPHFRDRLPRRIRSSGVPPERLARAVAPYIPRERRRDLTLAGANEHRSRP